MKKEEHRAKHIAWPVALKIFLLIGIVLLVGLVMFTVISGKLCWEGAYTCESDAAIEIDVQPATHLNFSNSVRAFFKK